MGSFGPESCRRCPDSHFEQAAHCAGVVEAWVTSTPTEDVVKGYLRLLSDDIAVRSAGPSAMIAESFERLRPRGSSILQACA